MTAPQEHPPGPYRDGAGFTVELAGDDNGVMWPGVCHLAGECEHCEHDKTILPMTVSDLAKRGALTRLVPLPDREAAGRYVYETAMADRAKVSSGHPRLMPWADLDPAFQSAWMREGDHLIDFLTGDQP